MSFEWKMHFSIYTLFLVWYGKAMHYRQEGTWFEDLDDLGIGSEREESVSEGSGGDSEEYKSYSYVEIWL